MADAVNTQPAAAAPPAWHAELADWPTLLNNGWDKLDAPVAAATIAKSYRELQKLHGGLAAGDVVRLPRDGDQAEQAAFWERMGTPKEASAYKLDELRKGDGTPLDQAYLDAARTAAANAHMPASMLDSFLKAMIPHLDSVQANENAAKAVAAQESRKALETEWGVDLMKNKFIATRAMDALGVPPEALAAMESLPGVGYKGIMQMMLKLGEQMGEARFVHGNTQPNTMDPTQAQTRLAALQGDPNWVKRFLSDNEQVRQAAMLEKQNLIKIITGA